MNLGMKILIVDDFITMRRIIKGSLKKIGFNNIIEAEDGNMALSEMKKDKIDLVISDWNMPHMTGLELLKAIRKDQALKDVPFIMVTAEGQRENVLHAVQEGVNNYVIKPFTPEVLAEKIKKVFKE
jgi:two-component system chemotaxis response regulator CheY